MQWMDKVTSTSQAGQAAFWLRPEDQLEKCVLHLLRSHIVSVESRFPGAGEICAEVSAKSLESWTMRSRAGETQSKISDDYALAIQLLERATNRKRRSHLEDAEMILSDVPLGVSCKIREFLPRAPLGTTISVRRSQAEFTTAKSDSGCSVSASIDARVTSSRVLQNPRIVLYDGNIDSVSQIHRVLADSAESGTSYLIVCRGLSDDVAHTVSVNNTRGTVHVILAVSRLDDLTIGAIDDIAAYTGSWVISAQSGESISSGFERLTQANGKFWIERSAVRSNSQPSESLASHVDRLRRDAVSSDQSVADFLEKRILGLSSSRFEIFLGMQDQKRYPGIMETVDSRMRTLVSSFTRGIDLDLEIPREIDPQIAVILREAMSDKLRTYGSALAGMIAGLRFARDLCTIGHAVLHQNRSIL